MIKVGIIGYGYWGPNLVRNFHENNDADIVWVCDLNTENLEKVRARYPSVLTSNDYRQLLSTKDVDAVAIATPLSTHFEIAMTALKTGKHIWVEKPLAASSKEASALVEEASKRNLIIMVDHTFVYTDAVRKIKELIAKDELGDIYYYDSVRVNLGIFQQDSNVIWDLAVHDVSILDYIFQEKAHAISAIGVEHISDAHCNIAYLTLFFHNNFIAHVHCNWLAPVKIRRTLIGGSKKMVVYDDIEPSEKIKVYDKGIMLSQHAEGRHQLQVGHRSGDMYAPNLEGCEALSRATSHFLLCIRNGEQPITGGESGVRVVQILELASKSLEQRGRIAALSALANGELHEIWK